MLTCREVVELVTEYVEGRMSPYGRLRFGLHLLMCRNCRVYVEQMKATSAALGHLPDASLPEELEEEMLAAFRNWKKEP
ncbi:MAG: anti-sigma factor family protein [Myxococcota bacterium]